MRKQYLHLSVYVCNLCNGPAVAGSLAVRENEISKETEIRVVGEVCLACGHQQQHSGNGAVARHFLPVEWKPAVVPMSSTAARCEPEPVSRK